MNKKLLIDMLNIGDRVKFLSDTGVGVITKIEKDIVWVEVDDGFEVPTNITDVVVVSAELELETLVSLGQEDERPGSKKAKHNSKKESEQPRKPKAIQHYGKISLVADDELEDGEEIIDLQEIKERYVRNLLAKQRRQQEIEEEELQRVQNRERTIESSVSPTQEPEHKPRTITLEELKESVKESVKEEKPEQQQVSRDKKNDDIEVIDLHIEHILDSTENMSSGEIITAQLDRFTISLETHIKSQKKGKIVYIHGNGKRKLRSEIEKKLKTSYPKLAFQDASFEEYGYGAILIMF